MNPSHGDSEDVGNPFFFREFQPCGRLEDLPNLVMTNSLPWKIDGPDRNRWFTELKNGGSFHGELLNNQMVRNKTIFDRLEAPSHIFLKCVKKRCDLKLEVALLYSQTFLAVKNSGRSELSG